MTKTINGRKKNVMNNQTKKEEEILYLYSNPINDNSDINADITPPSSVCEFVLGQKLGEGTFGTVRLGTNRQTGEKVAIKILEKNRISNIDDRNRIEREINFLKKIHHPNIVKLFCVIETGSQMFIVMEYIKGNELFQYIVLRKKLEEEEACYFFLQIINCIEYLHKIKISHRDLKAENIIIEQKIREIKLLDFGLSNSFEKGLLTTACGSPIYAAPEMLEGKSYKGSTVDIWSAGIILYYMLCGHFPFEDASNDKLYKKIISGKFKVPKTISNEAKDLINKILVVNPKKRITIKNIKNHPWLLNYLEKNNNIENIFKYIGLDIDKYVIPIDEDIVNEINNKYKVDKVQIRKNILYNIANDVSTLYYIILNKKIKDGIKSIADMKSDLYENYIKDKNNLLSSYNNDMKQVFEKRKNGPEEENEKTLENKNIEDDFGKEGNKDENNQNNGNNDIDDNNTNEQNITEDNKSFSNNEENNEKRQKISDSKTNDINEKRKNASVSMERNKNRRNQKKKLTQNNKAKNEKFKDLYFNYMAIKNDASKKNEINNLDDKMGDNLKEKIKQNIKVKFSDTNTNTEQIQENKKKKLVDDLSKSVKVNKNKPKIQMPQRDSNKNLLIKNLNKTVNIDSKANKNKHNKNISLNANTKISLTRRIAERTNESALNNNNNVSDFNSCSPVKKPNKANSPGIKGIKNKQSSQKNNNFNFHYYMANENKPEKKGGNNLNQNLDKNKKTKNNRIVLFKDERKNSRYIFSSDKNLSNLYNENHLTVKTKTSSNQLNKLADLTQNNKEEIINNDNNEQTDKNDESLNRSSLHKKNISSALGQTFISINKVKNDVNENKKVKYTKQHNKSFDIKKEVVKNKFNEDLNNFKKNKTNRNKMIKTKANNNNNKEMTSGKTSSYLTGLLESEKKRNINNNDNYMYRPFDINCLLIKSDKMIKDELMNISDNNFKIKNVQKQKYNIGFKTLDLSAEMTIEKYGNDNNLNLLKIRKILGKNVDYWNQLNMIVRKLSV